jgi:two-component system, sporulation sensor kinase B
LEIGFYFLFERGFAMEVEVKGILVNLLIIFLAKLIILLTHQVKLKGIHSKYQNKLSIFVASSIAIVLCMTFSYSMGDGLTYDLRYIPLVLGTLYGGVYVGIGLFSVLNIYRLLIGGIGFYFSLFSTVVLVIASCLFSKNYHKFKLWKKMLVSISLLHLTPLCSMLLITIMQRPYAPLNQWVVNAIIFTFGTMVLILFTEFINKHILLKEHMVNYEKSITVSQLAASIAHEVKNPLTTVRGFLQLLSLKEHDEKRISYYKTVFTELDRAEKIIHDYLTYAKPKSQEITVIDLKLEIEKTIAVIKPIANNYYVNIKSDLEPICTKGIAQHFEQALINILKNAIEAMPNGGDIFITLKQIQSKSVLSITDSGHGLSKEQINELGKPYFSTKGDKGTGLGLLVTFNVIKAMDGAIQVESEINKGTTFRISFPTFQKSIHSIEEVASGKEQ